MGQSDDHSKSAAAVGEGDLTDDKNVTTGTTQATQAGAEMETPTERDAESENADAVDNAAIKASALSDADEAADTLAADKTGEDSSESEDASTDGKADEPADASMEDGAEVASAESAAAAEVVEPEEEATSSNEASEVLAAAAADDDYATEDAPDAPPKSADTPVLTEGAMVGAYVVVRVLRAGPDERVYLAREAGETAASAGGGAAGYVTLIERRSGDFGGATSVIALGLRHPRLLAPRAILSGGERDYLVVETRIGDDGSPAPTAAEGAHLEPLAALIVGAGLSDALGYLHRNGVAHLHISPDTIVVYGGRGYLSGLESAEYIGTAPDATAPLVARDANFLARSLGILADLDNGPIPDETGPTRELRQIVNKGTEGGFTEPEEVAMECGAVVRAEGHTLPVLNTDLSQAPITHSWGMASSVGLVRSQNQDASAAVTFDVRDDVTAGQPLSIFLVADGMGGEAHGEIASRLATRMVVAEMARAFSVPVISRPAVAVTAEEGDQGAEAGESLLDALAHAVSEANRHIRAFAAQLGQATGTTLTAIAAQGGRAALAHLGDSRAYLLRGNVMAQLSEDHSVLARLQAIDHPLLSDPDAFVPRSMLYRSLGQEDDPNPDLLDFLLVEGDRLLLCSDGLWDEIEGNMLAQTLALASDPQSCAEQLVALANASGGHDNSTAVVLFVQAAAGLSEQNIPFEESAKATDDALAGEWDDPR